LQIITSSGFFDVFLFGTYLGMPDEPDIEKKSGEFDSIQDINPT